MTASERMALRQLAGWLRKRVRDFQARAHGELGDLMTAKSKLDAAMRRMAGMVPGPTMLELGIEIGKCFDSMIYAGHVEELELVIGEVERMEQRPDPLAEAEADASERVAGPDGELGENRFQRAMVLMVAKVLRGVIDSVPPLPGIARAQNIAVGLRDFARDCEVGEESATSLVTDMFMIAVQEVLRGSK